MWMMWVAPLIQDADFITPAYLEDDLHEPMPSHGTATRAKTPPWEYPLDVHPNFARHLGVGAMELARRNAGERFWAEFY